MLNGFAGKETAYGAHGANADHGPYCGGLHDLATAPDGGAAGNFYAEFYIEYAPAARRLALSMVPRDVADDIVAEAFTRVLGAIRAGRGPGVAFRGYLLAPKRGWWPGHSTGCPNLGNRVGSSTSNLGSVAGKTASGIGNIVGGGTSKLRTALGNVIPTAGRTGGAPWSPGAPPWLSSGPFPG